jgi:hypothetical protein
VYEGGRQAMELLKAKAGLRGAVSELEVDKTAKG